MQAIKRGYFSHQPPERWEEAMLCGNGTLGAIVMGQPLQETIIFTHEKLFLPWNEPLPPIDSGIHLAEIREMLHQGKFQKAVQFVLEISRQAGYGEVRWTDPFFPACDLDFHLDKSGEVRDYVQALDYSTGLASVEWQDERGTMYRRAFVSRADDIAVMQLGGHNGGKISCEIEITQHPPDVVNDYWIGSDKLRQGLTEPAVMVEEGWLYFRGFFRKRDSGYECMARIIAENGKQTLEEKSLRIENADTVWVILQIQPLNTGEKPHREEMKATLAALPPDFDVLLCRHIEIHSELFNRTSLEMGNAQDYLRPAEAVWEESRQGTPDPAFFQRIFDAGRYEIISSSGEWPPNLQGVWTGIYGVPWSSDYTQNGNLQTAIAGLLNGNLPECMDSYLRYLEFLAEDSKENAKALYRCRGILMASRTSSHGLNNHFGATYPMTFWTAGAGWAAHFFYDYWLHTFNDEFFIHRALPYMKNVALFYEDFLVEDEDGFWCFTPSYSPENTPLNSDSQACVNATMDIAVARELFNNLIEGCRTMRLEEENIPKWEGILAKMPAYQINKDGAAKEWCDPRLDDRYDHRHASHLYPLMYGVTKELADSPELLEAFAKAYKYKLVGRKDEANIMAFGSVQQGQAAQHLGDLQTVWHILQNLASGYYFKNFATSHDMGPAIFNADLSGGMTALIMETLIQSQPFQDRQGRIEGYRVKILPILPSAWKNGEIKGVLTRGGFKIDVAWENCELKTLRIQNQHRNKCVVQYQGKEVQLADFTEEFLTVHSF